MDGGMSLSRKCYVIVARSAAMQRDLEQVLSDNRCSIVSSECANVYIEGGRKVGEQAGQDQLAQLSCFGGSDVSVFVPGSGVGNGLWRPPMHTLQKGFFVEEYALAPPPLAVGNISRGDSWQLDLDRKELGRNELKVSLTGIEMAVVRGLVRADARFVSKDDLILAIGREPEHYKGLEMCLSRLQGKFKRVSGGERLVRAVRNQGYCLIQSVMLQ